MNIEFDAGLVTGVAHDPYSLGWPNMNLATAINLTGSRAINVDDSSLQQLSGQFQANSCEVLTRISLPALAKWGSFSMTFAAAITLLSLPALAESGGMIIESNSLLETISFPALAKLTGDSSIANHVFLTAINLSGLQEITFGSSLFINGNNSVATLDMSSLIAGGGTLRIQLMTGLTNLSLPNLENLGALEVSGCDTLTTFDASLLTKTLAEVKLADNPTMDTVHLDLLSECNALLISNIPLLAALDLSVLGIANLFIVADCPSLTSLLIGALVTVNDFEVVNTGLSALTLVPGANATTVIIRDNASLVTPTVPAAFNACNLFDGTGCALDQASVDAILAALDAGGVVNGSCQLQGGTSDTPSGAGVTSAANLTGKGWNVVTN